MVKIEFIRSSRTSLNYSIIRYLNVLYFIRDVWLVYSADGTYIHKQHLNSETRIKEE